MQLNLLTTIFIYVNLGFSVISLISLIIAILAYVKALSIEKATHSVQFMPAESLANQIETPSENWGFGDKEVAEINEEFKEELDELSI